MDTPRDQLIRRTQPEFASYFPNGKRPADSTLGRWIRNGTFPPPDMVLSARYKAWWASRLQSWCRGEWKVSP